MKKTITLLFLIIGLCSLNAKTNSVPKKIRVLSQSCTMASLYVTVIDLDNNEIVILQYSGGSTKGPSKLINVIRTGMFVDPTKQFSYLGTDVPFDTD